MVGLGEGSIFRLEVPFITSKALLTGIFHEVEGLALHKHPKNIVKISHFSLLFFYVFLSGHNMGRTLIVMLQ
jgi:hypothetical protein